MTTKPFAVKKLANCGVVAVDVVFDDATGGAPSMRNPRFLFGSALEGDGESDESSEDESGSRLERAKNFGSGVLSSIEKRVRPARAPRTRRTPVASTSLAWMGRCSRRRWRRRPPAARARRPSRRRIGGI